MYRGLGAVGNSELAVDVFDMSGHGAVGHADLVRDFGNTQPARDQRQNLALARG